MTGYGLGSSESSISRIEVSLRSVNGRFLESRIHLPREFIPFEGEVKKKLAQYFERGTVDVFVSRKLLPESASHHVVVNRALAKQYHQALKTLSKDLKLKAPSSLEAIARMPEVLKLEDSSELTSAEKKSLLQAFEKACKACDSERHREGKSLREDLEKTLGELEKEVESMAEVREEANQNLLARFETKIKSRLAGIEIDAARLSQEIVIQVEKSDINEELSRLKEHLKNYRHLLASTEAQGKKLDFYTQELLREVNTIGSKSGLSRLTQIVVQSKTLVERLREQVQNAE